MQFSVVIFAVLLPLVAVAVTFTVTVIELLLPAVIAAVFVQLTFCPLVAAQFQPVPAGGVVVDTVRPAGTASVTVTAPAAAVGAPVALLTCSVKLAVDPCANIPPLLAVFTIDTLGTV